MSSTLSVQFSLFTATSICSDFGALPPKKIKSPTVSPSICHEVMGLDAMILVFWMLNFKPTFSLSSFTFIKRLFSCSSLSAVRVVSSAYLMLLIFLLAILIPACASYGPAFSWWTLQKSWISRVTIYSLDVLLFGTSLFFHVSFLQLLPDLLQIF